MNFQEKYQKSKAAGYTEEEIIEFLEKSDPSFSEKMKKSQDAGYTPSQVLSFFNSPQKEKKLSASDYAKDFGVQAAQGFGIGGLGTYGDILDLFGLQAKEMLPGEKSRIGREFQTLEKMERGEVPSYGELLDLSENEVAIPSGRLPTSRDVELLGKDLGLVSDPETAAGRYGKRIGKLGGAGLSLGATAIAAPIVAGAAGQTLEELGAPPWVQAAAEIITTLKLTPKSNVPITSKTKEVDEVLTNLKKAGYSEQDLTLAKSALEERGLLKKYASLTPEAENTINSSIKNSETLFKEQIKKGLPGYTEGGLPYLEKQASNVYKTMEDLASTVSIKNTEPAKKAIQDAITYLEKYPLLDEQKKFIEFMKDGLGKIDKANTAEFFTGFYRNLGKAGNWGNPSQKEHLLGMVRKGIKDTFSESGTEAQKFGKYFEKTNEVWKHWIDSRDLMETLEKAMTIEGTNFKKIFSILNDKENYQLANKVLGPEQVKNVKSISEGAQAIESLLKQIPKNDKSAQELKFLTAIHALIVGGNKGPLATVIGMKGAKKYATSLLIDPEKQNRMTRLIAAAKNNSPQQAAIILQDMLKTDFSQSKEKQ